MAKYPSDDLDSIDTLKSYLGSFWSSYFLGQDDLDALLAARIIPARNIGEAVATARKSLSRIDVPVFSKPYLKKVTITLETGALAEGANPYNRGLYDCFAFPVDEKLRNVNLLTYTPLGTNLLTNGVDFSFEDGQITFVKSPAVIPEEFQDTRLIYLVDIGGDVNYWAQGANYDDDLVWNHAGYLVGINQSSSESYKSLVNTVADASIQGASYQSLCDMLEVLTGTPRVKNDGEVVEIITEDAASLLVITDQNVYKCEKTEHVIVAEGDVLKKGDWITRTVTILKPGNRTLPSGVTQVAIPASYTTSAVNGILTFDNVSMPLTVTTNVSGYTKITWDMPDVDGTGAPTAFFNAMHTAGVAAGKTLANYLDLRPQPQTTQPTASQLPTSINPAELLVNSILRNLYYIIILESTTSKTAALPTFDLSLLRNIIPPEFGYLAVSQIYESDLEIYFCTSCPSYDEWHFDAFNTQAPAATDQLILVPQNGGVCGGNTVKNTLLNGLILPAAASPGAGESITIKPSAGLTSGAGGSIVIQPGVGVNASDGTIVIKKASDSNPADLAQFKTYGNSLLATILNDGTYLQAPKNTSISTNTDNLFLTDSPVQRLNCTGTVNLTGIKFVSDPQNTDLSAWDGLHIYVYNVGSGNLVLKHLNASSDAKSRFYINKELADPDPDVTLGPNDYALLIYDNTDNGSTSPGWRVG